jgi:RNA-directed DNA polymerase
MKKYFDTIPHGKLMARIETKISDGRLLALIRGFLEQKVMEGLAEWTPEEGAPQGATISPLLANIYLDPLDHLMAAEGFRMTRYADDFVILTRTREEAERALTIVREWVEVAGLSLHPEKTRIANVFDEGFDFLGYRFQRGQKLIRRKSLDKLKDKIRETTRRRNGKRLDDIVAQLNPILRGWYGYFKHCHKYVLDGLDRWIRHRLRAILLRYKEPIAKLISSFLLKVDLSFRRYHLRVF